ncbi:YeeE/YedE thiosulfate transporter family protein [Oceanicola sp. 502str15]|uniref:YeeE/YedE thiosulfate transporter family protein n=1 Tax=Oceanicola sp. 502str15 TaxID=2696061 RepID=UPI0020965CE8|nr:YeeE/YedE thiosulfate transporter family protein [Oceanicola sp. 502str15]MCO6382526.1 YeeE/YedE family protein [Oceanicola sp. 502str15]
MFESFGFEELTARQASVWLGLGIGVLFGVMAQISRFCFRRAVAGPLDERRSAAGVWAAALALSVLGTQGAVAMGWISFEGHRFFAPDLPWLAVTLGGLAFGAGMVLTRGCVSRLTVLGGTGNLRALTVLLVFAVTAHATLKGILAPLRTTLGSATLSVGETASLAALPGGTWLWTGLIAAACLAFAALSRARPRDLALGALIGLLAPLAWVGTGFLLYDDFDPIAMESLSTTLPSADSLFWLIASSSIPPGFGAGLMGGILAGALLAALTRREFALQSFTSPRQTGRYMAGAVLMGLGGVLAGGCTLGAGLSGVGTLSLAALLALAAIALGATVTVRLLGEANATSSGSAAPQARPAQ